MKKLILINVVLVLLIISCTKKQVVKLENSTDKINIEKDVQAEATIHKTYVFVNAKDCLKLRAEPNLESEKIASLEYKEKVELIEDTLIKENIDGIEGSWLNVKTESGMIGYVFGGYIEKEIGVINYYDKLIGRYNLSSDDGEQGFFEFSFLGNGKVKFTTDHNFFNQEETIDLYKIINKNNILYETAAEMGFASNWIKITFLADTKEIVVYNHLHKTIMDFGDYTEDPVVIDEIGDESTKIYKKEI